MPPNPKADTGRLPWALPGCLDSYHVVARANNSLEKVRRGMAAELRVTGAAELKDTRWAVIKNPEHLSPGQRTTIAVLGRLNSPLYRAYLMQEQLREIYRSGPGHGKALLAGLISWCARSRIPEFVKLGRTLRASATSSGTPWKPAPPRPRRGHQHPPARANQTRVGIP